MSALPYETPDDALQPYQDLDDADRTDVVTFDANRRREIAALQARDNLARVLKSRRFDLLPVTGPSAPVSEAQGRDHGDSTTPVELADLIASIEQMGVLQPILVEERVEADGSTVRHIVAGERRMRAVRWGNVKYPDNPHFAQIPAVLVPGPLSEEDKRSWQLIENLAREDLKPGELAGALLFERCAILVTKLLSHGIPVPRDVLMLDSPVERFEALERLRGRNPAAAAPWDEVFHRLGLQMSARKARQLVAAFKALPSNLVEEMDEERIALSTRIKFIDLRRGREHAADEIWAAVRAKQQPRQLLNAAVTIAQDNPTLPAAEVAERAWEVHEAANLARGDALSHDPVLPADGSWQDGWGTLDASVPDDLPTGADDVDGSGAVSALPTVEAPGSGSNVPVLPPLPDPADPELVTGAIDALRSLVAHLADGHAPSRYDAGSLRLLARNLVSALDHPAPGRDRSGETGDAVGDRTDEDPPDPDVVVEDPVALAG